MLINNFTLKEARMYRGKTVKEMADHLKIHVQTYARIEKEPDRATFNQGKMIADFLEMEVNNINFFN